MAPASTRPDGRGSTRRWIDPKPATYGAPVRLLDTLRCHFYKSRPLWVAGGLLVGAAAGAEVVSGVQLPDGSQKVGELRYRVPGNYEKTLDYFKLVYPRDRFPRQQIINQPGVKALHIANPGGKLFEGINIYEANEEVRVFIIAVKEKPRKPAAKPAGRPEKGKKSR
jgi:hypothetical protein